MHERVEAKSRKLMPYLLAPGVARLMGPRPMLTGGTRSEVRAIDSERGRLTRARGPLSRGPPPPPPPERQVRRVEPKHLSFSRDVKTRDEFSASVIDEFIETSDLCQISKRFFLSAVADILTHAFYGRKCEMIFDSSSSRKT
ncbi:hypothetical protein CDAR_410901 [Caerostris darwini]|uniref:Uncharacterized protein n=1 Tax=Caerostris darwini TaxID=1538125 RepID=A0AAV4SG51_9ARAC|nr:hypothetical protein CDAR_410901 [Caerostris darwini]